jgi:preprotein translocase subunit YajC
MFISEAWAQAAGGGGGTGGLGGIQGILPFVLIFVVFYFLLIRPQQQKAKRHKELVKNLRRGDRVVTQGGILATVSKVINDGEVQVEIAENVRVRVLRNSVTEVLAKTEPVASKDGDEPATGDAAKDAGDDSAGEAPAPQPKPTQLQGVAGLISRFLGNRQ